jgi:hypothetical protein
MSIWSLRSNVVLSWTLAQWASPWDESNSAGQGLTAFYRNRRLVTVFTRARHQYISQADKFISHPPALFLLRSFLILHSHLSSGLMNDIFPSFLLTECRGPVSKTSASYSGVSGLKSQPGYRLFWPRFLWFFSVPPDECQGKILKLDLESFLPNPFEFITHVPPFHSTLYSLRFWKSIVK